MNKDEDPECWDVCTECGQFTTFLCGCYKTEPIKKEELDRAIKEIAEKMRKKDGLTINIPKNGVYQIKSNEGNIEIKLKKSGVCDE